LFESHILKQKKWWMSGMNYRKPRDSRLLNLSHAAGQALGIAPNRTIQGSMYLVDRSAPRTAVSTPAVRTQACAIAPVAPLDNQVQKPFWPFAEIKQQNAMRKAVKDPRAARGSDIVAGKTGLFGRSKPTHYGIPAGQYSPPVSASIRQYPLVRSSRSRGSSVVYLQIAISSNSRHLLRVRL
jgi:hypothetical protein